MKPPKASEVSAAMLASLGIVVLLALAPTLRGEEIPVSVTDIRVAGSSKASITFVLRNHARERLIAWSVKIALHYPDGSTAKRGQTTHCHTASIERLVRECEIEPGGQREEGPLYFPLQRGQPRVTVSASVLSAVFETEGKAGETWVGDRARIEPLLKGHAERQRIWKEILRILEKGGEQDEDRLQAAYERLGREGPKHDLTASVRAHLARALTRRSQGRADTVDTLELLIRTARAQGSENRPHVDQ